MVDVLTEINILSPCDRVSEYASNPDDAPERYVNIKLAEWRTKKPLTIDSQIAFKAQFLGRQLEYVYEIADFKPGQMMVMRTADGPFPMETTYTWEALDGNLTRMTLRNKGNPTGFSRFFAPFMSLVMKRANMQDLKKIKANLEHPNHYPEV